jgi:hypothetical protein
MFRGSTAKKRGTGGVMATRESNVIMFPQRIDPEQEDVRIAEQFLEKIDGLNMKGMRRDLAAAEARVLAGDAGAAGDVELLVLSIRRRLRDEPRRELSGGNWIGDSEFTA